MRVLTFALLETLLCCSAVVANVDVTPPVNNETIVGVWEGFLNGPPEPITLFWMQINPTGDSYLVQITMRAPQDRGAWYSVYKLVPADSKVSVGQTSTSGDTPDHVKSQMTGTPIELHFHQLTPEEAIKDVWIKGIGVASPTQEFGVIECTSFGKPVWFTKGSWTEDLGKASEGAKDAIKKRLSK
jgi:hypothetical protein